MRHLLWTSLWMLILGQSLFATARDFVPLQEKAMGHSLGGAHITNDSLYSNPAGSAFSKVYSIDGIFQLPKTLAVSVLDTKTAAVGGGLGYYRKNYANSKEVTQGVRLGLNSKITENLALGVNGKMIWGPKLVLDSQGVPVPGAILAAKDKFYGLDAGMLYDSGFFQLGTTFYNVASDNIEMGERHEFSVGGRVGWQKTFFVSATAQSYLSEVSPYEYGIGAEYVSPYFFGIRAGYRSQPYRANSFWSLGASFLSPKLSLHYVIELPNQNSTSIEHLFGATILM